MEFVILMQVLAVRLRNVLMMVRVTDASPKNKHNAHLHTQLIPAMAESSE
jgi:hypothetical protein